MVVFLKGVLIAVLTKYGKFKTHEQRREERQVLLAYREWRKNAGPGPTTGAAIPKRVTNRYR